MGLGLAKQIKAKWPEVYQADLNFDTGNTSRLGRFSKAIVNEGRLWVYNMYSQDGFGTDRKYTDYDAMETALKAINVDLNTPRYYYGGVIRIGVPQGLGCGLAGGDWHRVEKLLEDIYDSGDEIDREYRLVICKKEAGNE
jgi:hypothetical protein